MERICNLYISDEHLLVTLSSYLKQEIDSGTKVIVLSQDNMKRSIRDIKKRINNRELKERVNCLEKININSINSNKITIILKGNMSFINNMENKVKDIFKEENELINIISCYNINENIDINKIVNDYGKLLNTSGVININDRNDLR